MLMGDKAMDTTKAMGEYHVMSFFISSVIKI